MKKSKKAFDNLARSAANNVTAEQISSTNDLISGYVLSNDGTDLVWENITGGLNPLGSWDASTNTPTLTSGVGTAGDFYVVSVAGSTELDGISTWNIGDQVLFGNDVWNRIENVSTALPPEIISTSQSVTTFDVSYVVNTTTADITITIPDSDSTNGGQSLQVIKNSGDYNVIVQTTSGQNIGSDTSQTIENVDEGITVTSYGDTSGYLIVQDSRSTPTSWGEIEGDIENQTDLADELAKTFISVADIAERDAIPSSFLVENKIVFVADNGSGDNAMYKWNGASFEDMVFDEIILSDGASIESEDGNISIEFTSTGDDKGVNILGGQLSVGSKSDPRETCLGGGDSYAVPYAFHCTVSDTTGLTIINATDVSSILQSDSGSTTGLFGGTTSGSYILVGSQYPFGGAKSKVSVSGSVESDNVTAEYLFDSTPTWTTTPFMSTLSDFPYTSYANNLDGEDDTSFQYRFGFDPDNLPVPWNAVTLNINGVNYENLYWGRFRVVSDISQDVTIEQLKLHTNRFEINADGTTEYFGLARYKKTLVYGLESITPNSIYSPSSVDVSYGTNLTASYQNNRFANNAIDGFTIVQNIVEGLDTSIPLELAVTFYVDGSSTGDIEFEVESYQVSDGFVYDGSATPDTYSEIVTIGTDSNQIRTTQIIQISVNELTPLDAITVGLYRDATVSNTDDTLAENIIITNIALSGYFWRP